MNNAVYAKIIANVTHRVDARLVNNEKDYLKWKSKPNYVATIW